MGTVAKVLVIVMRRLAAVVAVFAVVFAPAATDVRSGGGSTEPVPTDLSGAVLAPTFTASELTLGRPSEDITDEHANVVGYSPGGPHEPRLFVDGPIASISEAIGRTESVEEAWSQRGPPAS